jgi:Ca2+-binding RTX toxin-like protein
MGLLALVSAATLPASAVASRVSRTYLAQPPSGRVSPAFTYVAFPGEVNDLNVGVGLDLGGFRDSYVIQKPDRSCVDTGQSSSGSDPYGAECWGASAALVLLGDGNDRATVSTSPEGNAGGPVRLTLNGGTGDDDVAPRLTKRGNSADGLIMRLFGGDGADRLSAANAPDLLSGETGNDRLNGGLGTDLLYGGPGADVLIGGPGDDRLDGGTGNDRAYTNLGHDYVDAGTGNDYVSALNHQRNVVRCGTGFDTVRADRFDVLIGCERRIG